MTGLGNNWRLMVSSSMRICNLHSFVILKILDGGLVWKKMSLLNWRESRCGRMPSRRNL